MKKWNQLTTALYVISVTSYYCFAVGSVKADGIYFRELEIEFDHAPAYVVLIYSVTESLLYLPGPIYAAFFNRVGTRVALLTASVLITCSYVGSSLCNSFPAILICFGVIRGLGIGIAILGCYSSVGNAFDQKRSLMNNVLSASSSLYAAIMAPIAQMIISTNTWRYLSLLQGGFVMNGIPAAIICAICYNEIQRNRGTPLETTENATAKPMSFYMCNVQFWLYCAACSGVRAVIFLQITYTVRYAQAIGISNSIASLCVTIYQIVSICTCLATGIISSGKQQTGQSISKLMAGIMFLISVASIIPLLRSDMVGYICYTVISGILTGSIGSLPMTLLAELFGAENLSTTIGLRGCILGVYLLILPSFTGKLIEAFGSFRPIQYTICIISIISGFTFIIIQRIVKVNNRLSCKLSHREKTGINEEIN